MAEWQCFETRYGGRWRRLGKAAVKMEALTAVSAAALTIYDMCKAVDRAMTSDGVQLLRKSGGKSCVFERGELRTKTTEQ